MQNAEVVLDNSRRGIAPFSMWFPIAKGSLQGETGESEPTAGSYAFEGPLTHPDRDLQGDRLRVIRKGLEYHTAIGGPVDWEHGYEKYLDADALIGEATRTWLAPHELDGAEVLHMRTEMFDPKLKPLVMKAVNHYRAGGKLGYSVAGGGIRESDTGRIVPVVTTVAMTIKAVQARNMGCLRMVKAISELESAGVELLRPGMLPVVPETWVVLSPLLQIQFGPVLKALECDAALPHSGPGISAAMVEDLAHSGKRKKKRKPGEPPDDEEIELADAMEKAVRLLIGRDLAERLALA